MGPRALLVFAWSVGGVLAVLLEAIVRLAPIAFGLVGARLGPVEWAVAVAWSAFMLWSEAWRGFHLRFAPRVVVRSLWIAEAGSAWHKALAPVVAMGLLHATRRRLVATWVLVAAIVLLILVIRWLPPPWRAIVDLGVVLGLSGGALSVVVHAVRALAGRPPQVPADLP